MRKDEEINNKKIETIIKLTMLNNIKIITCQLYICN